MSLVPTIKQFAGSRWVAVGLLVGVAMLLMLVLLDLGYKLPSQSPLHHSREPLLNKVPMGKIEQLLRPAALAQMRPFSGTNHPFFTLHFQPPPPPPKPVPAPKPEPIPEPAPPPPPVVKKLALLYQGAYRSAGGQKQAFLQVAGSLSILTPGGNVAGDWAVADIALQKLTLTNRSAQTNILEFNHVKELEIPVK